MKLKPGKTRRTKRNNLYVFYLLRRPSQFSEGAVSPIAAKTASKLITKLMGIAVVPCGIPF